MEAASITINGVDRVITHDSVVVVNVSVGYHIEDDADACQIMITAPVSELENFTKGGLSQPPRKKTHSIATPLIPVFIVRLLPSIFIR